VRKVIPLSRKIPKLPKEEEVVEGRGGIFFSFVLCGGSGVRGKRRGESVSFLGKSILVLEGAFSRFYPKIEVLGALPPGHWEKGSWGALPSRKNVYGSRRKA